MSSNFPINFFLENKRNFGDVDEKYRNDDEAPCHCEIMLTYIDSNAVILLIG